MRRSTVLAFLVLLVGGGAASSAEDVYYGLPLEQVQLPGGDAGFRFDWRHLGSMRPRVLLDGAGEAYIDLGPNPWEWARGDLRRRTVFVRAAGPAGKVTGRILVASEDGMTEHPFAVGPENAVEGAREGFLRAKLACYEDLVGREQLGAAWFRRRAAEVREELGMPEAPADTASPRFRREEGLEETYSMMSGGRALSENLALDRVLRAAASDQTATVPLESIEGITVEEFDWTNLLGPAAPELDPLASAIPADQHAVFFPTFSAYVDFLDEADADGTPILHWLSSSGSDAGTKARYEKQLLLSLTSIGRLLGPAVVRSVALTGSDPYLRTGSDVAILFEAVDPAVLDRLLRVNREAGLARFGTPGAKVEEFRVAGLTVHAITAPGRTVCSYQAIVGDRAVVVTNSLVQLEALATAAADGGKASLASLDEFRFFRERYRRGEEETAFLVITDQALRRWCGPRWRIATSRRTRAQALLADLQARLVGAAGDPAVLRSAEIPHAAGLGELTVVEGIVSSSVWGRLDFLTPIAEIGFDRVTPDERSGYLAWRLGYEQSWRQYYDPIAARFTVAPDATSLDLSVIPLREDSDYNDLVELVGAESLTDESGDPHAGTAAHFVLALDRHSRPMKSAGEFSLGLTGDVSLNFLDWVGPSVSIYMDDSPFFEEVKSAGNPEAFMEANWHRLPVALHVAVRSPMKLAAFLTAFRGFVALSAPDVVTFESRQHHGKAYVRIYATEKSEEFLEKLEVFYTAFSGGLLITLSEDVLKAAIDRSVARAEVKAAAKEGRELPAPLPLTLPWPGRSVALRVDRPLLDFIEAVGAETFRIEMQTKCWGNLPILNEWHRLLPDRDPVAVHEAMWGIRPVCPGGGTYVWNERYQTMESTVYGHPAKPVAGPGLPRILDTVKGAGFGVTFEHGGLRAKARIERQR